MGTERPGTDGRGLLLSAAGLVILIYGLREAQAIVVPILLAVFLSMVGTPPLFWLRRKGVPNSLAVVTVVIGMILVLVMIGSLVGTSIAEFTSRVPYYQERLDQQLSVYLARLELSERVVSISEMIERIGPSGAMDLAARLLNGVGGLLNNALLIVFTVVFILLEAWSLPAKLRAVTRSTEAYRSFTRFSESLNRYIGLKTAVSLATGLTVGAWVAATGLDFPMLWGLLAFMLNYVPNIGSIIAAVPAVLLALVQLGPGRAVLIAFGYLVINVVIGNLVEPRLMGRSMGLSTLVVFLSLIFWGWVLGPVGMLLSVPLTMTLVIALESNPSTQRLALVLCEAPAESAPPVVPPPAKRSPAAAAGEDPAADSRVGDGR